MEPIVSIHTGYFGGSVKDKIVQNGKKPLFLTYDRNFLFPSKTRSSMDTLVIARNNIKKHRTSKGLRQQDMADKLSMNLKSYQQLENGITKLDVERLNQISEILDVSIFDLLKSEGIILNQEIETNENIYNSDVTINNDISQSERKLFEKMIEDKDREIAFLRDLLSKKDGTSKMWVELILIN